MLSKTERQESGFGQALSVAAIAQEGEADRSRNGELWRTEAAQAAIENGVRRAAGAVLTIVQFEYHAHRQPGRVRETLRTDTSIGDEVGNGPVGSLVNSRLGRGRARNRETDGEILSRGSGSRGS